jgi:hypothetical protein
MTVTVTHHTYSSPFDGRRMYHEGECTLLNCEVAQYLFAAEAHPECSYTNDVIDNRNAMPLD